MTADIAIKTNCLNSWMLWQFMLQYTIRNTYHFTFFKRYPNKGESDMCNITIIPLMNCPGNGDRVMHV